VNSLLFDSLNELAGHSAIADDFMRAAARYLLLAIAGAVAIHWIVDRRRERVTRRGLLRRLYV